jgi:hypothetical protein
VRYHRMRWAQERRSGLGRGPPAARIPRLRLGRGRRPRRRRHRPQAGQGTGPGPRRGPPPPSARGRLRHRPHPLGHPRAPERRQRPPPRRLYRDDRPRPQRHRRELLVPQGAAPRRGPRLPDGDGHRGHRSLRREVFPGVARGSRPRGRRRTRGGLRRGLHLVARPGQDPRTSPRSSTTPGASPT